MGVIGKGQMFPNNVRDLSNVKRLLFNSSAEMSQQLALIFYSGPSFWHFDSIINVRDDIKMRFLIEVTSCCVTIYCCTSQVGRVVINVIWMLNSQDGVASLCGLKQWNRCQWQQVGVIWRRPPPDVLSIMTMDINGSKNIVLLLCLCCFYVKNNFLYLYFFAIQNVDS